VERRNDKKKKCVRVKKGLKGMEERWIEKSGRETEKN